MLSDKAKLKSCESEMAYFVVLVDKLQCHFLRIKLPITAQTSVTRHIIVLVTTECSLLYPRHTKYAMGVCSFLFSLCVCVSVNNFRVCSVTLKPLDIFS